MRRPAGSPSFLIDEPTRTYVHCKVRSTHDIADVGTAAAPTADDTAPSTWP